MSHVEVQAEEQAAARQLRNLERARRAAAKAREAKRKARPRRLKELAVQIEALGREYRELPPYPEGIERRRELRREISELVTEEYELRWGPTNRG